MQQRIFSVSELTASIRGILETQFTYIKVAGEISNLRKPHSGHLYFTLKDSQAQLKTVLFKMQQRYLDKALENGQQVICHGRISVYEPRGDYQLIVDTLEFHGAGELQKAFERLKKGLASEGLFEASHKKRLPEIPLHIALVTSPKGAAVHDFIRVATMRFPLISISVYPVPVQGEQAADEIITAINTLNRAGQHDLIVLCRGGGSIEDLWAFNEEKLARAIFNSSLPVVSAIGHEIDYTIADFVADLRAPTPSAAAEMILPDRVALDRLLKQQRENLFHSISTKLNAYSSQLQFYKQLLGDMQYPLDNLFLKLDYLSINFERVFKENFTEKQRKIDLLRGQLQERNPHHALVFNQQKISELKRRLLLAGAACIDSRKRKIAKLGGLLDAVSPLATLSRGYAIARKKTVSKSIVARAEQVREGEKIEILLHNGRLDCSVDCTYKENAIQRENEKEPPEET